MEKIIKNIMLLFTLCLFTVTVAHGQYGYSSDTDTTQYISISGILPSILEPRDRPYLATNDIFVAPGSTVRIAAGVTILFKDFIVFHVQGVLHADGTREDPVVFTSINDSSENVHSPNTPAPFDWNGIDVYDNALGTTFTWCNIRYSVYGIRSQITQFRIINSTFLFNGKSEVTISGEQLSVGTQPFSFRAITEPEIPMPAVENNPQVQLMHKETDKNSTRIAARIAYFSIGCAGLVAGGWGTLRFRDSNNHFEDMNINSEENKLKYTVDDYKTAKTRRNTDAAIMAGGYTLGLIGTVVFFWSFTF